MSVIYDLTSMEQKEARGSNFLSADLFMFADILRLGTFRTHCYLCALI